MMLVTTWPSRSPSPRRSNGGSVVALVATTDPPFDLRGDGLRLGQVVTNIIGNSLRYTPAGGRIDVALTCDADTATFVVADTGAGIEPELLPYIFDRFR